MSWRQITFTVEAPTLALGRNGYSKACGLTVSAQGSDIILRPINSKKDETQCRIPIPIEDVPAVIAALLAQVTAENPENLLIALRDILAVQA